MLTIKYPAFQGLPEEERHATGLHVIVQQPPREFVVSTKQLFDGSPN